MGNPAWPIRGIPRVLGRFEGAKMRLSAAAAALIPFTVANPPSTSISGEQRP
jgi:hypothetical protein